MYRTPTKYYFLLLSLLLIAGSSCNTKKILQPGERLVDKNIITLKVPRKDVNVSGLRYQLSTLAKPVPNSNYLFFFDREVIYHNNSQPEDTTRIRRFKKNKIGEKPAIFAPELAEQSAEDMKFYLGNKGFFDADVKYKIIPKGKHKVKIEYTATTGNSYNVDSVFFLSEDTKIKNILMANQEASKLQKGAPVSLENFQSEVSRITRDLKNRGYFDFDRNFIDTLRGDSTGNAVSIYLEIFTPKYQSEHQVYHVGKVNVYPNYYPGDETNNLADSIVDGIHFRSPTTDLRIKAQTIIRSIFLRSGEIYREDNLEKTNLQLSRLNNFKAISVIPKKDSVREGIVHFDIYLSPKKKLELGLDWELNNSNYTQTGDRTSLLGTSLGANYRNLNLFKTATELDHRIKGGVELNLQQLTDPDSLIYSADASYTFDMNWPKFVHWTGPYKLLDRIKIGKDKSGEPKKLIGNFYQNFKENAKSTWSINFSVRNISIFYLENSHNTTFGYDYSPDANHRFVINHTGLTLYFVANQTLLFDTLIIQNPFIGLSSNSQLFTGLFFRNLNYSYTSKINPKGESWFFNGLFELSGHEVFIANSIYNGFVQKKDTFQILGGFEFAQYSKLELDIRYYHKFKGKNSIAFRANAGIARPFGLSERVPYVQQFFLGGGNSMRGWKIRELGPGAVPSDTISTFAFFQAGDLKLEVNGEYRFKIFGDLDGALFLDIGNIWSLDPNDDRGRESQFHFISGVQNGNQTEGFLNQMAIGSGFGIRWDFSYFILRFDMGVKLRHPFRDPRDGFPNKYWFYWEEDQFKLSKDVNLNLAIGYPF